MLPRDFHFLNGSAAIFLLWLIPFFLLYWWERSKLEKGYKTLFEAKLISDTLLKPILFVLGWVFATLALMEPVGGAFNLPEEVERSKKTRVASLDLYFLVDTSLSMSIKDALGGVSRLVRAKEIADIVLRGDVRDSIALFSLSSGIHSTVPLSYDPIFVRLLLDELEIGDGDTYGTDYKKALNELKKQVAERPFKRPAVALLFSDGGDNEFEKEGGDSQERLSEIKLAAKEVGIPIYTIGIGSLEGGEIPDFTFHGKPKRLSLDEATLKEVAAGSLGKYFAPKEGSAERIAGDISGVLQGIRLEKTALGEDLPISDVAYKKYFQIPLFFALLAWGILIVKTRNLSFFSLIFCGALQASDPGHILYETNRFDEAAFWYESELKKYPPLWLQDKLFYNLGVALAAEKKWPLAEVAFQAVSKEAFAYPIFRSRLLTNLKLAVKEAGGDPEAVALDKERLAAKNPEALQEYKGRLEKKIEEAKTPKEVLVPLMQEAMLLSQEMALSLEGFEEKSLHFFVVTKEWQKEQFKKGICLCYPWHEVIPAFQRGLEDVRGALSSAENRAIYLTAAFWRWEEALKALDGAIFPNKSAEQQQAFRSEVQELQQMQKEDRIEKKKQKSGKESEAW